MLKLQESQLAIYITWKPCLYTIGTNVHDRDKHEIKIRCWADIIFPGDERWGPRRSTRQEYEVPHHWDQHCESSALLMTSLTLLISYRSIFFWPHYRLTVKSTCHGNAAEISHHNMDGMQVPGMRSKIHVTQPIAPVATFLWSKLALFLKCLLLLNLHQLLLNGEWFAYNLPSCYPKSSCSPLHHVFSWPIVTWSCYIVQHTKFELGQNLGRDWNI